MIEATIVISGTITIPDLQPEPQRIPDEVVWDAIVEMCEKRGWKFNS